MELTESYSLKNAKAPGGDIMLRDRQYAGRHVEYMTGKKSNE